MEFFEPLQFAINVLVQMRQQRLAVFRLVGHQQDIGVRLQVARVDPLSQQEIGDTLLSDTNDPNQEITQGVAVGVGLSKNRVVRQVDVFDLFRGDVFTLSQLEEVLHSVDDVQSAILVDFSHVTSGEPAFFVHRLGSFLGVLVVSVENLRASQLQFTAKQAVIVLQEVTHFREFSHSHFHSDSGGTQRTGHRLPLRRQRKPSKGLGKTVPLSETTGKRRLEELHRRRRDGG